MRLVASQRISEAVVEIEGYYGLGQLVEVSPQDVGSVVDCVSRPVQAFAIAVRRVKDLLQLLDALLRSAQAEYAFDVGRCKTC
jgi:hypothetical protein